MNNNKILIVDDDKDILDLLTYNLKNAGFQVSQANSGQNALNFLNKKFDLLILDVMIPDMNGYILCQKVRQLDSPNRHTPVIFLTAKNTDEDELLGFEMGANDFIIKPVKIRKLLARVKANIKRHIDYIEQNSIKWGKLEINPTSRSVIINSKFIHLTKTEFNLLFLLVHQEGKVFSRDEILDHLQEHNTIVTDRVIDVHIRKIRKKLSEYKVIIETVHGIGYLARRDNITENF